MIGETKYNNRKTVKTIYLELKNQIRNNTNTFFNNKQQIKDAKTLYCFTKTQCIKFKRKKCKHANLS